MQLLVGYTYPYEFTKIQISMDNLKKNVKAQQSDEDFSPKETPPKKRKGSGEQRTESEKKALHRERVRINEQKRRERVKDYFATLKELLPKDQQNTEMTKEEILLQAIQMLQDAKGVTKSPEKSRLSPVPQVLSLTPTEVTDTFLIIHRDVYQKVFNLNSTSSLHSTIGLCSYMCELAQRSMNPIYLLHAQTTQVVLYTFLSFNPAICMSIFESLIPLYEQLTDGDKLIRIEPALGCSEWVLPTYSLVLSSLGKFDKAMVFEKRALKLAGKHTEVAAIVFACLYFIRQFRGETLSISESLEACKALKMFPQYNNFANLTFGLSLLQQGQSVQDRMEAKAIIEQSEDAINCGPYFDMNARVMLIQSLQILNPVKALRDIEDALALMDKNGKTGCFTKADLLQLKADTLLRMRQDSVEEYMLTQMAAEGIYQEAINISTSLGLFACTLKCALSLCKMFKVQGRSELAQMGHYLLQLVIKLEKETTQPSNLMNNVREFLATIVKIEIV